MSTDDISASTEDRLNHRVTNRQESASVVDAGELSLLLEARKDAPLTIQDETVYELVTYCDGAPRRLGFGNWCEGGTLAKAVLTYLAMKAFNVHRLPWHHDHSFSELPFGGLDRALQLLKEERVVSSACAELRRLHGHTVKLLHQLGVTHVRLRRGLQDAEERPVALGLGLPSGYASRLATMGAIAQRLDRGHIDVPFNVLSSWSACGYSQYSVVIEHDVPVASIAWCSAVLASRDFRYRLAFEGGEWVVLNRAADGRLRLRSDCVVKSDVPIRDIERWPRNSLEEELASCEQTYGSVGSMYRDGPYHALPLTIAQRLRRSWAVLFKRYA